MAATHGDGRPPRGPAVVVSKEQDYAWGARAGVGRGLRPA